MRHKVSLTLFSFQLNRVKERIDAHKPTGPYPSHCHLVLVGILVHTVVLCLKEIREKCNQPEKDNNPR